MRNKIIYTVTVAGMAAILLGAISGKSAHPELMFPLIISGSVIVGWFVLANKKGRQQGDC